VGSDANSKKKKRRKIFIWLKNTSYPGHFRILEIEPGCQKINSDGHPDTNY